MIGFLRELGAFLTMKRLLLTLVVVTLWWMCATEKTVEATATSPDSMIDAVIYSYSGGGATVGTWDEVRLQPRASGPSHGLVVLDAYGLHCIGVRWEGKRALVIQYDDNPSAQAGLTQGNPVRLSFGGSAGVAIRLEHGPNIRPDTVGDSLSCVVTDSATIKRESVSVDSQAAVAERTAQ
jgi:hypothetical protein